MYDDIIDPIIPLGPGAAATASVVSGGVPIGYLAWTGQSIITGVVIGGILLIVGALITYRLLNKNKKYKPAKAAEEI